MSERFIRKWVNPVESYLLDTETDKKYFVKNPKSMLELFNTMNEEINKYKNADSTIKFLKSRIDTLEDTIKKLEKLNLDYADKNFRLIKELETVNNDFVKNNTSVMTCHLCGGNLTHRREIELEYSNKLYDEYECLDCGYIGRIYRGVLRNED